MDGVGIGLAGFRDDGVAAGFGYDDEASESIGDGDGSAAAVDAVVGLAGEEIGGFVGGGDAVADHAAAAREALADDGLGDVAGDVEGVVAGAAEDCRGYAFACAEDEEGIVVFQAIDGDR